MADDNGTIQSPEQQAAATPAAAGAAAAEAAAAGAAPGGQPSAGNADDPAKRSGGAEGANPFQELGLDPDSLKWMESNGIKDVQGLVKNAHEQSKLLGNAIRVPGPNATPEEIQTFHEKLGVPKTIEDYGVAPPADLPADLPYDGERAKTFLTKAKELGVPKTAAKGLHDWFVQQTVADFNGAAQAEQAKMVEGAKTETEKLVKLYGPVDGQQFRAQAAYADDAIRLFGGEELKQALVDSGMIGQAPGPDGKTVTFVRNAAIFNAFAKAGRAYTKEDNIVRGDAALIDNPFEDGASHNVTKQMKMLNEDRPRALANIAAAGKKPADFGIAG